VSQAARPAAIFVTSWDDGHPLDARVAELLAKHDLPGTFYIPQRAERGVMPAGAMCDLASQFEIGAHTLNHVDLTGSSDAAARSEIAGSKRWIEDTTGRPCLTFCFPMGRYRRKHLGFIRDAGYDGARTVELLSTDPPRRRAGVAILPTTMQVYSHRPRTLLANVSKRCAFKNLGNLVLHARHAHWNRSAASLLGRILARGGVFHLWGHSWEIEERNQWRDLDDFLALMGRHKDQALRLTCAQLSRHADAA